MREENEGRKGEKNRKKNNKSKKEIKIRYCGRTVASSIISGFQDIK